VVFLQSPNELVSFFRRLDAFSTLGSHLAIGQTKAAMPQEGTAFLVAQSGEAKQSRPCTRREIVQKVGVCARSAGESIVNNLRAATLMNAQVGRVGDPAGWPVTSACPAFTNMESTCLDSL
jgi:hypothetical protein